MLITSTVTMTELLVQPYRDSDDQLVDEFYGLLSTYPDLSWIAPNLEIAIISLQAASAEHSGAIGLITNDPVFERVKTFETLVLDHLL